MKLSTIFVALVASASICTSAASLSLPKLHIDHSAISVSGISSGADFVVQFQVAYSAVVNGVGVFAGQPYHCAVQMVSKSEKTPQNNNNNLPCCS